MVKRVFQRVSLLEHAPALGPRIQELPPSSKYRQLVIGPCRVFYRPDLHRKKMFVIGVMRGDKLFQRSLLFGRDWPSE
jgi:toxin ParE1/3/4